METAAANTGRNRIVNVFFDSSGAARKAVDDLVAAGIPREHMSQTGGQDAAPQAATVDHDRGFWDSLKDLFLPDEDRHAYAEGLRRGGYLLSVNADEGTYSQVLDILDADGAINMDEREGEWRSEGWLPATAGSGPVIDVSGPTSGIIAGSGLLGGLHPASDAVTAPAANTTETLSNRAYDSAAVTAASTASAMSRGAELDSSVPSTAAAASSVGRRDNSHGRTRVRSYVLDGETNIGSFSPATDRALIVEHMDVISADGQSIGTVDHLDGPDRIRLARNTSPDGQHLTVPFAWIDHVDQHVHLKKTLAEIKAGQ